VVERLVRDWHETGTSLFNQAQRVVKQNRNKTKLLSTLIRPPLFQSEASCKTFHMELSFICMWMKTHFHMKGCAPRLALKKRYKTTRKWPIHWKPLYTDNSIAKIKRLKTYYHDNDIRFATHLRWTQVPLLFVLLMLSPLRKIAPETNHTKAKLPMRMISFFKASQLQTWLITRKIKKRVNICFVEHSMILLSSGNIYLRWKYNTTILFHVGHKSLNLVTSHKRVASKNVCEAYSRKLVGLHRS